MDRNNVLIALGKIGGLVVRDGIGTPILEVEAVAAEEAPERDEHGLDAPELPVNAARQGLARLGISRRAMWI